MRTIFPFLLLLVAGCQSPARNVVQLSNPAPLHAASSRAQPETAVEMPSIDIPVPPIAAPNGADLYSAPDPAGPWIYRTDDVMVVTNAGGAIIWNVPRTPGASQEFYQIVPL